MSLIFLKNRIDVLKAEYDKAVTNLTLLNDQIDKSKSHILLVQGHLNEATYQLQEFSNLQGDCNAEVNNEEAKQPTE